MKGVYFTINSSIQHNNKNTTMATVSMPEDSFQFSMGVTPKAKIALEEMLKFLVRAVDPASLSASIDKIFLEFSLRLKTLNSTERSYFNANIRDMFVRHFSWAIPHSATLASLANHLKGYLRILEVGAGTGLWAHLLKEIHGVSVVATDKSDGNYRQGPAQHQQHKYCSVEVIDAVPAIEKYDPEVLMLIWAPYSDPYSPFPEPPMATDSLRAFKGNLLVWIGEEEGGCNADVSFFEELHANWKIVCDIGIPSWFHIYDGCSIWKRNESVSNEAAK